MIAIRPFSLATWVCFILFTNFVLAALQNVTVDDAVLTGPVVPICLPSTGWAQGNQCSGCAARPDPSYAYNGTWHDTTFHPINSSMYETIQFTFVGSGLYIFFILANNLGVNITSFTNVEFTLDNVQVATFTHNPTTNTDYDYNQTVYANNSIPYGEHTMLIAPVNDSVNSVLILFDYLIYTTNADSVATTTSSLSVVSSSSPASSATTTTTSPNVGAIVGGTVAGVFALVLVITSAICYRRHRRRGTIPSPSSEIVIEPFVSSPHVTATSSPPALSPLRSPSALPWSGPKPNVSVSSVNAQPLNPPLASTQSSLSHTSRNRENAEILEQVGMLRNEVARLRHLQDQSWSDALEVRSEMPPEYS